MYSNHVDAHSVINMQCGYLTALLQTVLLALFTTNVTIRHVICWLSQNMLNGHNGTNQDTSNCTRETSRALVS